ncbi:INO80 complex subunit B [Condylostylus longicornis]|uniref:INO80 complex subunit B n=1 Tax=Condylostylus longicornis TaxID=2530218 RepID=UPI00244DB34B|nr:INO80 complex subunit B [Condylostylus longicornis]
MGKHKDYEYENFTLKRHHKKKKHKHKHQKSNESATIPTGSSQTIEYDSDQVDVVNDLGTPLGQASVSNNTSTTVSPQPTNDKNKNSLASQKNPPPTKSSKKKKGRGRDSGTSSDEERWLDAIESGKLEEVDDELKKIKDPKLMTARQRAMYERGKADTDFYPAAELLMSLPTGYREKEKVMTAEAIQKAQLNSIKRKQLADEKREKDKKKTMERLLKKQETKQRNQGKNKQTKVALPMQTYINNIEHSIICLPVDHEFSLKAQEPIEAPKPILCSIVDCNNIKNYNCSKTNVPLCSFACYKKNLDLAKEIIC